MGHRAASGALWVTITRIVFWSRCRSKRTDATLSADALSRLPVGSSQSSNRGALPFAARERVGPVIRTVGKPHLFDERLSSRHVVSTRRDESGDQDVFED